MPGLLRGVARVAVISGTATAVSNNVSRRQMGRYQQQAQAATTAPAPVPAATSNEDQITQLQQLAQLKDQGILTQAEFDAKKKQILGL